MNQHLVLSACLLALAFAPVAMAADAKPKFASKVVMEGTVDIDVDITDAKQLFLVVSDGGNGYGADWADWVDPVLVGANGETKLVDIKAKNVSVGWGNLGINKNAGGGEMKIGGKPVTGIGVHAPSVLTYDIEGKGFTRFKAKGGVDNGGTDQGGGTSVQFHVFTEAPPAKLIAISEGGGGGGGARGLPADESVAAMEVAEGTVSTLWASEPMFSNPTNLDIDAYGRVWVCEGLNYRQWSKLRPEGDRIMVMEDSDGDGKADKSRVFYQGTDINSALGICVLGNKIIVSCSPNVFLFTDNGEGKPPTKELLFSGIAGHQHDHGMHAFMAGPDGKLYFNYGNSGERIKDKDGKAIIDLEGNEVNASGKPYRQGMVFRCNYDFTEFETLGHNFRNNYEVAADSFGTMWQSDNDDDGNRGVRIAYVMEHGNFGYTDEFTGAGWNQKRTNMETETPKRHWHLNDPGVVPNFIQTGAGSPTGILVYEGTLLPAIFRNQVIHCEPGANVVRSYVAEADGAGYKATIANLVQSKDRWFRPSDVAVAPDGALFIADWFDPGVGGHAMGDHDATTAGGRLFRVAPSGNKPVVPKLDLESLPGQIDALCSPNLARRYLAWTKLNEQGEKAEAALLKVWQGDNPRLKSRALHLLARIKGKEATYVGAALKDANADLRIVGLRLAQELKLDLIPLVKSLVKDPSIQVRRQCAISLRQSKSADAPALWAELAAQHDGVDRWYLEALGLAADKNEDAYFGAWIAKVGEAWNTPAGRDIVWRSRADKALPYLVKIIKDKKTTEAEQPRYMRSFDFHKGPAKDEALKSLLE